MSAGGHCELAIRMCVRGGVVVVLACCIKQNLRVKLIF